MIFQIIGIVILIFFYAIYIGKMIAQRKKGIKTDQIAYGNKTKKLFLIELTLKVATYSIVLVELLSIYYNTTSSYITMRIIGAILGFLGVIIFAIAVYTMRDSWRAGIPEKDKTELVTTGIFRISRNPAFLGFDLVYIAILLMFFNWVLFAFSLWTIVMLDLQIREEEDFLVSTFETEYAKYKNKTRRYIGVR